MCIVLELALHGACNCAFWSRLGRVAKADVVVVAYTYMAQHRGSQTYVPTEQRFLACLIALGNYLILIKVVFCPMAVTNVPRELWTSSKIDAGQATETEGVLGVDGQ